MRRPRSIAQLHDLGGRTALVTGGSRGLGLQMAHALGEAGARLMIASRKEDELTQAAAELRAAGHSVETCTADVRDEAQLLRLAESAMSVLGQVDILVNNAGATWGAPAQDHPTPAWDKVMEVNARSTFVLCREVARRSMLPRGHGRIINVSSIAALGGSSSMQAVAYHASKAAVAGLTRALACEWGPLGINVNAILPGVFPSRMGQYLTAPGKIEPILAQAPLRRIGDHEDLKGAVLLLASDAGKHITGVLLPVDGGASAVVGP